MGSNSRLKCIYKGMKARCYNSNSPVYARYGGRGIKVCDEWLESFHAFERWAMDNGYADDLSIDRINVNGDYEPSNCRWSDPKIQSNNKRHYWLPKEETDFTYSQSPNLAKQEEKRNEVKSKLRKFHLTQVWLINQLRMRDYQ